MTQRSQELDIMSTATAAVVIDASAAVINNLLGETVTGGVNDESLTNEKVVELVAARLNHSIRNQL